MTATVTQPQPDDDPIIVSVLKPATIAMWRKPINGEGGWQRLSRKLQAGIDGNILTARTSDINALLRMLAASHGKELGGWQRRAKQLIVDVSTWEVFRRPPHLKLLSFQRLPRPEAEQQELQLEPKESA